ncbi:hypothetical protein ACQKFE_07410 [Stutzerimonas stutzeri]|uniref:hypothetical protein n=1 Tax=Stutzerimonas TaxID=2901164 RepID=UPI0028A994AC|nr:hypothetical protein [Stutzerimonas nitrititolerans]
MDLERFDIGELERKLLQVATEIYGYDRFRPDTPMHEIRATAEQAGMMFGRMIAAALHSGPVTADIALDIRINEQQGKERFVASIERLLGPGGELR